MIYIYPLSMNITILFQKHHNIITVTNRGLTLRSTPIGCLPHIVFEYFLRYSVKATGSIDSIRSIPFIKRNKQCHMKLLKNCLLTHKTDMYLSITLQFSIPLFILFHRDKNLMAGAQYTHIYIWENNFHLQTN